MKVEVLVPLALSIVCLLVDAGAMVNMIRLLKTMGNQTVGAYGRKVRPYLRVMQISSVLMMVFMILAIVFR